MCGIEIIKAFLQQAIARSARSDVINPLRWLNVILLGGLGICLYYSSPGWLLVLMAISLATGIATYISFYAYFALTSPDSLRSERFSLSKMVIEKSIKGDDLTGLLDPSLKANARLLPNATEKPEEVADE